MKSARHDGEGMFRAPRGSTSCGRIVFVRGASCLIIGADATMDDLYRARFGEAVPRVWVEGSTVTVRYPRPRSFDWPCSERSGEVVLSTQVPWRIEFEDGVSRLAADLSGLDFSSFEVEGGASRVELRLPKPSGSVPVCLRGGISNVVVRRPEGVAALVRVSGGVTNLTFDEQHFGVVGDEVDLRTPDYDDTSNRYDIETAGGTNNLTVDDARHGSSAFMTGSETMKKKELGTAKEPGGSLQNADPGVGGADDEGGLRG